MNRIMLLPCNPTPLEVLKLFGALKGKKRFPFLLVICPRFTVNYTPFLRDFIDTHGYAWAP